MDHSSVAQSQPRAIGKNALIFFSVGLVALVAVFALAGNTDSSSPHELPRLSPATKLNTEMSQWVLKVSKEKNTTNSCAAADKADTQTGCPNPDLGHPTWTQYASSFPAECGCAPAVYSEFDAWPAPTKSEFCVKYSAVYNSEKDKCIIGPAQPVPDALSPKYSPCGCVTDPSQVEGGLHVDKTGCSAGNGADADGNVIPGNPLGAKFLDSYPWCYVKSATSCGAAFPNPKRDQPAIRLCGAWLGETHPGQCTGPHCKSVDLVNNTIAQGTLEDFIQNFLKDDVKEVFNAHNVLKNIQGQQGEVVEMRLKTNVADPVRQHNYQLTNPGALYFRAKATIIIPAAFLEGDDTPIGNEDIADWVDYIGRPDGTLSTPYAGELFNGFSWTTGLDDGPDSVHDTVRTAVPSCLTPPYYKDGWSDKTLVEINSSPPFPCVCAGKCLSSLAYGDGTYFSVERKDRSPVYLGKVKWWIPVLDAANIYITTGA